MLPKLYLESVQRLFWHLIWARTEGQRAAACAGKAVQQRRILAGCPSSCCISPPADTASHMNAYCPTPSGRRWRTPTRASASAISRSCLPMASLGARLLSSSRMSCRRCLDSLRQMPGVEQGQGLGGSEAARLRRAQTQPSRLGGCGAVGASLWAPRRQRSSPHLLNLR